MFAWIGCTCPSRNEANDSPVWPGRLLPAASYPAVSWLLNTKSPPWAPVAHPENGNWCHRYSKPTLIVCLPFTQDRSSENCHRLLVRKPNFPPVRRPQRVVGYVALEVELWRTRSLVEQSALAQRIVCAIGAGPQNIWPTCPGRQRISTHKPAVPGNRGVVQQVGLNDPFKLGMGVVGSDTLVETVAVVVSVFFSGSVSPSNLVTHPPTSPQLRIEGRWPQ